MRGTKGGFTILTFVLIGIIGFCAAGTVQGQGNLQREEKERWYQEREAELQAKTRDYLSEAGFYNSGVTLNRSVDEAGDRSYIFTIHHRRIDCMNEGQRQALGEELSALTESFEGATKEEHCSFAYRFLVQ